MSVIGFTTKFIIGELPRRTPAVPVAWVADVRFYPKLNHAKLRGGVGQSLVSTKKCIVWNPKLLHEALKGGAA